MMATYQSLVNLVAPDPWTNLRSDLNLYRAVEPSVKLIAMTIPLEKLKEKGVTPETIPAYVARHCHASHEKYGEDPSENHRLDVDLNKSLIKRGHTTPLQAVNYVFDFDGVTKALQTHWTRHKVGVGWSFVSTRYKNFSEEGFVYNTYDYIDDESTVGALLLEDSVINEQTIMNYNSAIKKGARKQDARKRLPLSISNHGSFFVNARALRGIMDLRLDKPAEWEIRRLNALLLDAVMSVTPNLFEDIYEKFLKKYSQQ